jgi:hypothetical protein
MIPFLNSCLASRKDSGLQTDLGSKGNKEVEEEFEEYQGKGATCVMEPRNEASPKRVLLTGFGLFVGVEYNISGVTIQSLMDPKFWPDSIDLEDVKDAAAEVASGTLKDDMHGGLAKLRKLHVNGHELDVCMLLLDVKWDLAAAIVLYEAEKFQPDVIIMSGRGDSNALTFEGGAQNVAEPSSGFDSDGDRDRQNTPRRRWILKPSNPGVQNHIPMTWDNKRLATVTSPLADELGHLVSAPGKFRPSNDYICNNVSYVVLHGIQNVPITLAGDLVNLKPTFETKPKTGFMHYPTKANRNKTSILTWGKILFSSALSELDL